MVGVRAKDHDDKRQLILDRSAELFARQGFHKTSIAEIAKACKASSKAWIYHYFPNKEAVLFALLGDFIVMVTDRVRGVIAPIDDPRAALRAFVTECLRIYDEYRINYPMLFSEMTLLPAEQQKELRALEREYALLLRRIVEALNPGIAKKKNHAMALTLIAFGSMNWTYTWFDARGPLSLETVADLTTKMLLSGVEAV